MCVKLPNSSIIIPYEGGKDVNIRYKEFNNNHLDKHWHRFFELEFLLSGNGTHKINENSYPIQKGEMHLMKLTDIHEFLFEGECKLYMVQFPVAYFSEDINSVLLNCKRDMIVYFEQTEVEKIEHLYKLLMEETEKKDFYNHKIIKNIITTLILLFFRKLDISERDIPNKNDSRINNIIIYLQNNFHHSLNISEMAERFHLNSEHFSRYFKKHMGIGPKEYLVGIRMDYAKKLVRESQMKILDICMACGYNSMATFLRDFKNKYNCAPRQMREENKKAKDKNSC